ncbi:helix-turn-helix domain-containing protein [Stecheria sp. CLA-KB-P133]|uniref:Helix-turn-helix domain-containing protein n=1 Tax=Grylomicrobium aquisgranensis TaxID=2926318 RepID=A0AB35U550_9FIRM|nr:helix-turn-helix domain-containing protein [Stecheria sp. CLA-KB-P133]
MSMIKKGFVIRLYPNQEQLQQIRSTTGCSRWLYNQILEMNNSRKELDQNSPFLFDRKLNYLLPCLKEEHPWLKEVDSTSLTGTIDNIGSAYKRWLSGMSIGLFNYPASPNKDYLRLQAMPSIT